ncbi:MAG: CBS domain-containing protein [Planctomycetota bacterium]
MVKVSEVMIHDVHHCRAVDPMTRPAQIMWERDCGCVPVTDDGGEVVGMITDRDLAMAAYTSGKPLGSLKVGDAMAPDPVACSSEEGVEEALQQMSEAQVRRLPVVDGDRHLVGIVSMTDLIQKAKGTKTSPWTRNLVESMAHITMPRSLFPGMGHSDRATSEVRSHMVP